MADARADASFWSQAHSALLGAPSPGHHQSVKGRGRTSFRRLRHIFIMSSSSSRKRSSSSRTVATRAMSRWCRVFTLRTRSRLAVLTCGGGSRAHSTAHQVSGPLHVHRCSSSASTSGVGTPPCSRTTPGRHLAATGFKWTATHVAGEGLQGGVRQQLQLLGEALQHIAHVAQRHLQHHQLEGQRRHPLPRLGCGDRTGHTARHTAVIRYATGAGQLPTVASTTSWKAAVLSRSEH